MGLWIGFGVFSRYGLRGLCGFSAEKSKSSRAKSRRTGGRFGLGYPQNHLGRGLVFKGKHCAMLRQRSD